QGSLGASGDLAPLAGLALPLIGLGRLLTGDGVTEPAADGLGRAGLRPLELQAKEGLALVNGTQGMLAIGTLALIRSEPLAPAAGVAGVDPRAASLPAARSEDLQRSPAVPDPRERAQQRVHVDPVHRRLHRLRMQIAGAPGVRRFDPVERRPGGPREHGDDER